jgi:hypothetical protein
MGSEVCPVLAEISSSDLDRSAFWVRIDADRCLGLGSVGGGSSMDFFFLTTFNTFSFVLAVQLVLVFRFEMLFRKLLLLHFEEKQNK